MTDEYRRQQIDLAYYIEKRDEAEGYGNYADVAHYEDLIQRTLKRMEQLECKAV